MSRSRTWNRVSANPATATMANPALSPQGSPARTVSSTCVDSVGKGIPHGLSIDYQDTFWWSLNGTSRPPGYLSWAYNGFTMGGATGHVASTTIEPTDNTSLSLALARTNPSRPTFDAPVFIYELKDIPDLFRSWGHDIHMAKEFLHKPALSIRNMPRKLGEKNLEWQFGIMPFMNDLAKTLQVQKSIEKKLKMLRNFQHGRSAGGLAVVWKDTALSSLKTGYVSPLYQETNTYAYQLKTDYRKWVSVTWNPAIPLPLQTDEENWWRAFRLATGLEVNFSTLWEAFPWSWFVDWFTNVGDIIATYRNNIPVRHDNSCIMLHASTRIYGWRQTGGLGTIAAAINKGPLRDTKLRRVVGSATPVPEFNMSILSDMQLSILGSIAATRRVPARK